MQIKAEFSFAPGNPPTVDSCLTARPKLVSPLYFLYAEENPHETLLNTVCAHADYRFTTFDAPGSTFTSAPGINAFGEIAGSYDSADRIRYGYLRSADGSSYTTIDFPYSTMTGASGVNASEQVVGRCVVDGIACGYVWMSDGSFLRFDVPFGAPTQGQITGINGRRPDRRKLRC
jgi:hypothetical protein